MAARPALAIVVQRYGPDVTGGSESLARAVAERLAGEYQVTVLTTCALDYVTWRNERPAGKERIGGVDVKRFLVEEERDLDGFNRFWRPFTAGRTAAKKSSTGCAGRAPTYRRSCASWKRRAIASTP